MKPTSPAFQTLTDYQLRKNMPTYTLFQVSSLKRVLAFLALILLTANTVSAADYLNRREFIQLVNELEREEQFDRQSLVYLFSDVKRQNSIITAMNRPAEAKPWRDYRPIFITSTRIDQGLVFWKENEALLKQVELSYGVPAEIIIAIIGVETQYGRNKGSYRVIDALATLGFDYPKRSTFFRNELKQFLILSREAGLDPAKATGSYAGAMGFPQFIPSSYRNFAVDYNKDGRTDLINSKADSIASVANYFVKHGWQHNGPVATPARHTSPTADMFNTYPLELKLSVADLAAKGFASNVRVDPNQKAIPLTFEGAQGREYWLGLNNFYVITRYNHSPLYAMAVFQLSEEIKKAKQKQRT